jgi:hypothetical protein
LHEAALNFIPEAVINRGPNFLREFAAACGKMLALVEFTTVALGLAL